MTMLDPFGKTEVWVVGIRLHDVRLPDIAAAAARALSLNPTDIFVVDVRDEHIVLDVLTETFDITALTGRGKALTSALAAVPGVEVSTDVTVHSHGVLGLLGAPTDQIDTIITAASDLAQAAHRFASRRVAILSTGAEIHDGRVHDTNLEAAHEVLTPAGFQVDGAGSIVDDEHLIADRLEFLVADGHGMIITTGGVGAETKDRTIEGIQLVTPYVSTAVLSSYEVGHGRHSKPHVRVAVGTLDHTRIVALPGPTREARTGLQALIDGLAAADPDAVLVERIATRIRSLWPHGPMR